ncbi:type V CRISPR-associated protein Cas4 [Candidatus Gottesmanbacteria bacterium CG_4_10_14_0_8_um_filter_37_24]|uniref:CRISPR-associated exonuclease Cas4 n=2 Tax=Candidatus Gottesmaniibacteriota TaxID=1752720 RepID=A0A2M7RRD2_9BACT|nr:MAG: hypothetical protein AUJ73_00110 [Candidatus Gottesmanbacteria bacterium CG1_02_37_22]PIP32531.1 MAG: endonuclease [Candidatus Gottesmanbacteria bacterium CG23_combo_of_CG06-09_8_20_14_all_37_19]PIZ02853.1 MAG: type V CRISPR-associated protein Cas4 [Candidatus Gottesmanbacteria bacterium CG_4_10_14_0_8_um_filter_37_24]
MDSAIPISAINDFIFCPLSLYYHSIYSSFDTTVYHDKAQTRGKIAHETIDSAIYTTSSRILQGLSVYSSRLGIKGKIDIYNLENEFLIERKYHIRTIFDGHRYQLYAQMYCLFEANLPVRKMFLHSLKDNKRYEVELPDQNQQKKFEDIITSIHNFMIDSVKLHPNPAKCTNCIYHQLCNSNTYVNTT